MLLLWQLHWLSLCNSKLNLSCPFWLTRRWTAISVVPSGPLPTYHYHRLRSSIHCMWFVKFQELAQSGLSIFLCCYSASSEQPACPATSPWTYSTRVLLVVKDAPVLLTNEAIVDLLAFRAPCRCIYLLTYFVEKCYWSVSVVTELLVTGATWCQLTATVDVPRQRCSGSSWSGLPRSDGGLQRPSCSVTESCCRHVTDWWCPRQSTRFGMSTSYVSSQNKIMHIDYRLISSASLIKIFKQKKTTIKCMLA